MTLYSCLPSQGKISIIATWPGEDAESHSKKVTTFTDSRQASRFADGLTRISESMWDAAAWLDVYDKAETYLQSLIHALRETTDVPTISGPMFEGCRHRESWTGSDLAEALSFGFPTMANTLTRAQRLSIAEELEIDAMARHESLQLLPTGHDPVEPDSRVWQAADITMATKMGLNGNYLPDGSAGWVVQVFDIDHGPAERWGARTLIHRLEQLEAASKTVNARGGAELEPGLSLMAHLVLPASLFGVHLDHSGEEGPKIAEDVHADVDQSILSTEYRKYAASKEFMHGDAVLYISPNINMRNTGPWERDVFAKIDVELSLRGQTITLATLEATDTDGFVEALGSWVLNATFRN
ncbi:hypothetical protein AOZ07_01545 [Glutamicibacter halophytocola]|uniref:hypothetical protein n=1 Tax=Glutamicibacter halophytocola TaxID=1933880 RepID=UPI0006D4B699|nr:hypothetical protein [Glutamicibacter halophytocola]ALG27812.1 hypothetical protein AOZ07_01545 [Glutamicibacter halophytocola]